MKDELIEKLPKVFKEYITTIKKSSIDNSKDEPMCDSSIKVINFDKIPNVYSKGRGFNGVPKSNDALYIGENKWYFIEFKNGEVDKADIYRKIYDSLIMLLEMDIIPDWEFIRKNIEYILVYNSDKYPNVQESKSREDNYNYFLRLAKEERKLFGVEKFEKYLFNVTHTYTKDEFKYKFLEKIKVQELS